MTPQTFAKRLEDGKVNNLTYSLNGNEGLVSVWKHEGSFILTWEECPAGEQYDESTYTRDERHVFTSTTEVLEFIAANEMNAESFTP